MNLTNISERMFKVNAVQRITNSRLKYGLVWTVNGDNFQNPKAAKGGLK